MRGEIGAKLKKVIISHPYQRDEDNKTSFDLQLVDENNEFLWICGDNDIPKLLQDALKTYYKNKKRKVIKNVGF